jgi:hypothetical protein
VGNDRGSGRGFLRGRLSVSHEISLVEQGGWTPEGWVGACFGEFGR